MKPLHSLILCLSILLLNNCHPPMEKNGDGNPPQPLTGEIKICGAYALAPFIQACANKFQELNPGVHIGINPMAHDSAMHFLMLDSCQLAMISRPLRTNEEKLFAIPVAKTGVVLIFNRNNPFRTEILSHGLTIQDLQKVYSTKPPHSWNEFMTRQKSLLLNAYVRADQSGASEVFADFLYLSPPELKGLPVDGEHEMIRAVAADPNGLGYCNVNDAFDLATGQKLTDIEFLPIDLNMNGSIEDREQICDALHDFTESICKTTYPFKLSRNLSLIAVEKPGNPVVKAFLGYVISEGQSLLEEMGYAQLPESLISYNRYLLK